MLDQLMQNQQQCYNLKQNEIYDEDEEVLCKEITREQIDDDSVKK